MDYRSRTSNQDSRSLLGYTLRYFIYISVPSIDIDGPPTKREVGGFSSSQGVRCSKLVCPCSNMCQSPTPTYVGPGDGLPHITERGVPIKVVLVSCTLILVLEQTGK